MAETEVARVVVRATETELAGEGVMGSVGVRVVLVGIVGMGVVGGAGGWLGLRASWVWQSAGVRASGRGEAESDEREEARWTLDAGRG